MHANRSLKLSNIEKWNWYLDAISKISDSCILDIKEGTPGTISSIVSSPDKTLILYGELAVQSASFSTSSNIPDIKKLIRAFDVVKSTADIELIFNSNNIEYKGYDYKFKYHLYEDGFLSKPAINLDKIKSFKYNVSFFLPKSTLQTIIRGSTFATNTNKLYLYTEDGKLKAELTDRARHNTDVFCITISEQVDFNLEPIPLSLDNIKLLTVMGNNLVVNINTEYGVSIIDVDNDNINLKYILTSLTQ